MGRSLLILVFFMALFYTGKSEYNGHFIDFNIELKNGSIIEAHSYLSSIEYMVDSGSYQSYLENRIDVLLRDDFSTGDKYVYHLYRLKYKFHYPSFDSGVIHTLAGKKTISKEEVKSVHITNMIDQSYAFIVVNELSKKDESWMKEAPLDHFNLGDELNSFDVFIHEKSEDLAKTLVEIVKETKRYEQKVKELESELEYMDGSSRQEFESQLDALRDSRAVQVQDALGRLSMFKVVIIGYLSC